MADETRIIKIEVEGAPSLDKATQSVTDLNKATAQTKTNTQDLSKSFKDVSPALDNLSGGAVSAAEGVGSMTKSALAFIATPLGAIIGAIGLAVGALVAYFKSSEEGQNRWNKIITIGKTLLEALMNVVEKVGEVIFDAFSKPEETLKSLGEAIQENLFNRFTGILNLIPNLAKAVGLLFEGKFGEAAKTAGDAVLQVVTGVEHATDKVVSFMNSVVEATNQAIQDGQRLADMQAKLDKDERDLIVSRAQTNLEVSKLRREAVSQEADEKRATIQEAIALEEALAAKETEHAQLKLEQAQLELQANGDDKDAKLKVAEATAAVINAESARYEATLRFSKEIEKLDDAERARREKMAADALKRQADTLAKQRKAELDETAAHNAAMDQAALDDFNREQKAAEAEKAIKAEVNKAELGGLNLVTKEKSVARIAGTVLLKSDALKETGIQTYKGAISAYSALAGIPVVGPVLGVIAAGLLTAYGLSRATSIAGVGFADGGYTGVGSKYQPAGIVHANEYVIPSETVNRFGSSYFDRYLPGYADGGLVTNEATSDVNNQIAIMRAIKAMPPSVNSWKEFTELDTRIKTKQAIVSA